MFSNKKIICLVAVICFSLPLVFSAVAAEPFKLKYEFPCQNLPGAECPSSEDTASDPAAYITRLYQFALVAAVMLSLGMIIFGGLQYILSRGKPAAQSDANDRIIQALWGLVLLLGAFLILNTIDPELTKLKLPLTKVEAPETPALTPQQQEQQTYASGGVTPGEYQKVGDKCGVSSSVCAPGLICDTQSGKCITPYWGWKDQNDPTEKAKCKDIDYHASFCAGDPPTKNHKCCLLR